MSPPEVSSPSPWPLHLIPKLQILSLHTRGSQVSTCSPTFNSKLWSHTSNCLDASVWEHQDRCMICGSNLLPVPTSPSPQLPPPSFRASKPETSSPLPLHVGKAESYSFSLSSSSQPLLLLLPPLPPPPFLASPQDSRGSGPQCPFPEPSPTDPSTAGLCPPYSILPFTPSFQNTVLLIHVPAQNSSVAPFTNTLYTASNKCWVNDLSQNSKTWGIPWWSTGYNSVLSLPGAQVRSLVEELRSHKPHGTPPKKKNSKTWPHPASPAIDSTVFPVLLGAPLRT